MTDVVEPPPVPSAGPPQGVHDLLTRAVGDTYRMVNQVDALLVQQVLQQFDVTVLQEQAAGRAVLEDGACERAFEMHVTTLMPVSRWVAGRMLSCGRFLRDRLPATWARYVAGECDRAQAFAVADATAGLGGELIPLFDTIAAALAGTMPPARLKTELERVRVALDPEAAIKRARAAATRRGVSARPAEDGMGQLLLALTALDTAAVHDGLHQAAVTAHGRAGETRTIGVLMADIAVDILLKGLAEGNLDCAATAAPAQPAEKAAGDAGTDVRTGPTSDAADSDDSDADDGAEPGTPANPRYPFERAGNPSVPGRAPVTCEVMVLIPADTATGQTDRPAELAGFGPLDADTARHVMATARTCTRVLTDPVDDAILGIDAHKRYVDKGLRRLVATRQPTCACGCGRPTLRCDLDHVWRFEHDGRTRHTNLQGVCRRSHEMKDAGWLDVRLIDGNVVWHTRWGGTRIARPMFQIREPADPSAGADDCPF